MLLLVRHPAMPALPVMRIVSMLNRRFTKMLSQHRRGDLRSVGRIPLGINAGAKLALTAMRSHVSDSDFA